MTMTDPAAGPPADPAARLAGPAPTGVAATAAPDRVGRIETHGIDHIPDTERHGRPIELFWVWAGANVNYLSLVVGGTLVLMGLSLGQALAVIVLGNLAWLLPGFLAVSGPAAGAPSEVITRAMYGVRGNRVYTAISGWLISVCYFALNLAAASVAAFALLQRIGIEPNPAETVAVVVAIAAITLAISVFGHAAIVRLYLPITIALVAAFAVVAASVLPVADFSATPGGTLTGIDLWATGVAGVTLIAAGPMSYTTSADFSRYLPRTSSKVAIVSWTALGGFLPSVLVCSIGALAATAVDMSDPQNALTQILPGWFAPVFLLSLVLGTISVNALTAYSAGLALQAIGVRISRSRSVLVDGAAAVALTLYGLLISNFLDTVGTVLQLTVVLLGPSMAIYATDIVLRRNRYDGIARADETRAGRFWFRGGFNPAGAVALLVGVAVSALCVDSVYTGPIAALIGVDVAMPAGLVTAAVGYAVLTPRPVRR
jgi:NCS1 family nucleobase:cation symporter-1